MLSPVRDAEIFYRFSLRTPWGQIAVTSVIVFVLWFLAPKVWRHMTTERLSSTPTLNNLTQATHLEPDRAEYRNQLGTLYLLSTESYNPGKAVENFRLATELNPAVAQYWMNLSRAYEAQGRSKEAAKCVKTALLHDPRNPLLAWISGNTKMMAGDIPGGLEAWRDSILGDRANVHFAFDRGWRLTQNTQTLLDHLVPPDNESDSWFLDYLAVNDHGDPTLVWQRILNRGQPFNAKRTASYMSWLLQPRADIGQWRQGVHTATRVWPDILRLGLGRDGSNYLSGKEKGNLITNGGFEQELLNMGFDWRWTEFPNINMVMDSTVYQEGRRALRIDFNDSDNVKFDGLKQFVAVEPGHHYRLTAQIKADRITGGSSPRLVVLNPSNGLPLAEGREVFQTREFIEDRLEFTVPRDIPLAIVEVRRAFSQKFSPRVKGSFWLDNVAMIDLGAASGSAR